MRPCRTRNSSRPRTWSSRQSAAGASGVGSGSARTAGSEGTAAAAGRAEGVVFGMTTIRQDDFITSIADALQHISYYHPLDYIRALGEAYEKEQGPAAKDAIAQILTNSRMCAEGHRPICQDTGIVNVFVKWGQDCRLESSRALQDVVDDGVRRAYNYPENKLRA